MLGIHPSSTRSIVASAIVHLMALVRTQNGYRAHGGVLCSVFPLEYLSGCSAVSFIDLASTWDYWR
jgi:hypothetical protein